MAKKRSMPDWLPVGWRVEVRGRKKIKWYCDPSKGIKFCSKADVLRYLSSVGSTCSKSSNVQEIKEADTGKVPTEKCGSEGLPPGWVKEMRVRRKGHKVRKDPYYIDPVSGQTFRSMKEVSRFLETRESGNFESRPGDQCPSTAELGESFSSMPAEADNQLPTGRNACCNEVNSDEKLKLDSGKKDDGKVVSDPVSGEHQEKADDVKIVSDRGIGEHQEKEEDDIVLNPATIEHQVKEDDCTVVSDPASLENQEKDEDRGVSDQVSEHNQVKPSQDGVEKDDQKTVQNKRKKDLSVPRRASKRLAGIKADTSLKLQADHAHVATLRQQEETATTDNPVNYIKGSKHVATAVSGITAGKKVKALSLTSKRQEELVTSPLEKRELPSPAESAKTVLASCEGVKKAESTLESCLSDIWTDPCIEFAIKTLTGTIPDINEKKGNEIPGPCQGMNTHVALPSEEIWADPCFMFAVKTLTGEIPIGDDFSPKIVQQQRNISQFQGNNGLILQRNIRLEEFCQANPSHFGAPEKALYKQQPAAVAPNAYQDYWFTKFGSHQSSPLC